jgi:cellulose synthase/poly-beta-1,6-N-acetylglucosamine synthase-like glycosyltransferase
MAIFFSVVLTISSAALAVPVAIFVIEVTVAVAFASRTERTRAVGLRERIAVLVPAHNESAGLMPTLSDIKQQLDADDRLLVVADNCTDDTAAVALTAGAEVVERHEPLRRGKGYALDFGLQYLSSKPPKIVIAVDADCRLADNSINELAMTCAATGRPVQALYLMSSPEKTAVNYQVAEFAWRVKNWLRPLGLKTLGLPCQLMGTGMAFPWEVIRRADLANGWLVEDLRLGLDLTAKGYAPVFCPSARVTSEFASSARASKMQRERWEHGHISTIALAAPRLLANAIAQRNLNLLALTLDLAVPPLSLLAALVIGTFAVASLYTLLGFSSAAQTLSAITLLGFLLGAFLAWLKCGRDVLPMQAFLSLVPYVLRKLGLYGAVLSGKADNEWIKTDRTESE